MQLFERETKREKVLEGIYREKILQLRADTRLAAAREKMRALGLENFRSLAARKTEMDLEIEAGIRKADKDFFDSIEKDLRSRRETVDEDYSK